ncbi:MAG: hypothetical protein MZV63_21925 [Marinilabiliales bacterium]|nr:hypothetical protein [Marinilabiliales bacterium]
MQHRDGMLTGRRWKRITGVHLYRIGEKIDTSEAMPVLRYHEGIVFEDGEGAQQLNIPFTWRVRITTGPPGLTVATRNIQTLAAGNIPLCTGTASAAVKQPVRAHSASGSKSPWYFSPLAWIIYPFLLVLGSDDDP